MELRPITGRRRIAALVTTVTAVAGAMVLALTPGTASAVTTWHTGSGRPALAVVGNRLYVAWAGSSGTAAAKELVFGYSTNQGADIVKLDSTEHVPQDEGAAIDGDGTGAYVAWPAGDNGDTLTAFYYSGTAKTCRTAFTGVTSPHAPALVNDRAGNRYLAWTDPSGHVNVGRLDSSGCATTHTLALTDRHTFADTSPAGPALMFDESGSSNLGVVIAWTGTDPAHTLDVATYNSNGTLTARSHVTSPVGATDGPGLSSADSDVYIGFRGTDGGFHLAYSEGCNPTCFNDASSGNPQASGGIGMVGGYRVANLWSYFDATGHLVISHF
ncbi:hypothetical protein ACEZDB_15725 [Streptacidiphilus sp. N1-3]|uniref:Uncharacterized protein n=1 Tax=Streptacidiphilus alkalitolerans TaxID=3342712 RepID=A0ABV6X1C5_9ACTN